MFTFATLLLMACGTAIIATLIIILFGGFILPPVMNSSAPVDTNASTVTLDSILPSATPLPSGKNDYA